MKSGLYKITLQTGINDMQTFAMYSSKDDKYYGVVFQKDTDQEGMRMLVAHQDTKVELVMEDDDDIVVHTEIEVENDD